MARSDPGLDALFRGFARRTGGCDMSWIELEGPVTTNRVLIPAAITCGG